MYATSIHSLYLHCCCSIQYTQIVLLHGPRRVEKCIFENLYYIYTTLLLKNILWCIVQLGYILQCTKLLELLSKKFWEAKVGNTKASDLERLKVYLRQLIMEMPCQEVSGKQDGFRIPFTPMLWYIPPLGLDILFSSNHNIHKSSYGFCFCALDSLLDRF